jgi:hypothetical protein
MFREVFVPTSGKHSVSLPKELYGKTVEVIAFAIDEKNGAGSPKKTSANALKLLAGSFPDMPSLSEIRKKAWPSKW